MMGFFLAFLLIFLPAVGAAQNIDRDDEWYMPTADKAALLYVREIGKGRPVVVLHGGYGAEYSYLLDAVKGLTSKYHFIFYDQRGSLRSPCKLEAVSYQAHIDDLESLRKALGLEKLTIFAHSMGTMLAASYMKQHPDRVERAVLAGCAPMKSGTYLGNSYPNLISMYDAGPIMADRREVKNELAIEKARVEGAAQKATHLWRITFAGAAIYHVDRWPEMKGGMIFFSEPAGSKASTDMFRTLTNDYDFSRSFVDHPYAATVISGDHDYADFLNRFFTVYSKQVPIRYRILKDAGHNMWMDAPGAFRVALDAGLAARPGHVS